MPVLNYLAEQPLITLVLILVVGLAAGKVKVLGISLGTAAVLFVAIALSAMNPEIQIPSLLFQLGLAMFVYAIGLTAGGQFFADFRTRGWRLSIFALLLISGLVLLTVLLIRMFGLAGASGAGMFAGSLTSTPAMAEIVSALEEIHPERAGDVVIGYSLAYPGAVLGAIAIAAVGAKLLGVDHDEEARKEGLQPEPPTWRAFRLPPDLPAETIGELPKNTGHHILATRIVDSSGKHTLAHPSTKLLPGMVIVVNGTAETLDAVEPLLGEEVDVDIHSGGLDYRRLTVSSSAVAGRTIGELNTLDNGFLIVRLRRGDSDVVPTEDEVLNYSDRVRVVASPKRIRKVSRYFGDSERSLADLDLLPFTLGLLVGLMIGEIPIPLPGGQTLSLGFGGGPIVAGLVLGALNRTKVVNWQIPYHANRTISTLGLALFLAGVGTTAGAGFREALTDLASLKYVAAGFLLTAAGVLACAVCGRLFLRLTWDESMGMSAGINTNPAVLSYLNGQTGTELPTRGYATVYPTAMIVKILAGQVLLLLVL